MCALLWFRPSVNLKGVGLQIDILIEMLVALGAFLLLGSIVNLLMFPKFVMKNIANMHRKHNV